MSNVGTGKRRYMLVIPMNGFNDQMCVLGQCISHCKKFDRIILLVWNFNDVVQVVATEREFIITNQEKIAKLLEQKNFTVFPPIFQDNPARSVDAELGTNEHGLHTWKEASIPSYLSLNDNYREDIIIHRCPRYPDDFKNIRYRCGSSIISIPYFTLTEAAAAEFLRRRSMLPDEYNSLHIRNTDIETNMKRFLMSREAYLRLNPLFLATDSAPALEMVRKVNPKVITIEKEFPPNNVPLHTSNKHSNTDMISDLLLLANGKNIVLSRYTGFGILAKWFQEHTANLLLFQGGRV